MTRLLCRVLGHQLEPARRVAVTPAFDGGRPIYETCDPADSRPPAHRTRAVSYDPPRIHRTPMLGFDRRWTVYYGHPVNGQPFERWCITRAGARRFARRVERAYAKAGKT